MTKYYDHDKIWERRDEHNHPVWGSYSVVLYKRILSLFDERHIPQGNLVDFGCGAGKFGEMAELAGFKYLGIDDSGAAIKLGQKTWPEMKLLEFDLAGADLPAEFQNIGAAGTAINSLHCLTEAGHRQQFLRNMSLALQPGANLFVSTMVGPVSDTYRASENPRLYLDPDAVVAELAEHGFKTLIYRADLPATHINGIPNLEVIVQKSSPL